MITELTLLEELALSEPQPLDPVTEVCATMYAKRLGLKASTAQRRLDILEAEGVLTAREAVHNGRRVRAYRKAVK